MNRMKNINPNIEPVITRKAIADTAKIENIIKNILVPVKISILYD